MFKIRNMGKVIVIEPSHSTNRERMSVQSHQRYAAITFPAAQHRRSIGNERKCALNYVRWHNKIISTNCILYVG